MKAACSTNRDYAPVSVRGFAQGCGTSTKIVVHRFRGVEQVLTQGELTGVEAAREQHLVEDAPEPLALLHHHLEELTAHLVRQTVLARRERPRGAVDARERCSQLVRDHRDDFG